MKTLLRSFAGGEITPELYGRPDLTKYQTGLAKCLNMTVLPHGPATRRPGFEYRAEVKDSTKRVRLIPFAYSATQTVILEFGDQYIRFFVNGGALLQTAKAIVSIVGSTVTVTGHGWSTGDDVYIGTRVHRITSTGANTFTTADRWGAATTASGTTAARVYTIASPYLEADLFDLHYAQDSDVLTICHPSYAARELARNGATDWTLTAVSFAAPTNAPTTISVTETIAQNEYLTDQVYVITSVNDANEVESLPSAELTATNNLTLAGNYNTITWTPVNGASRYNVYKRRGGSFGYIGQAKTEASGTSYSVSSAQRGDGSVTVTLNTSLAHGFVPGDTILVSGVSESYDGVWTVATVPLTTRLTYTSSKKGNPNFLGAGGTVRAASNFVVDDNVVADMGQVPPDDLISLNAEEDEYPSATTYFEQRRWFAGTNDSLQGVWATRNATSNNLTSSVPSRDDDAMEFRIAAQQQNAIRHMVPLSDILAFTVGGEFRIYADNAPNITPTSLSVKPQGYAGASNVQPALTSGSVLYVQAQGSRVREIAYNWQSSAYSSIDISIMSPHLFDTYSIVDLAYVRAPVPTLWCVRSDGTLLGLTYVPEQEVYGWHQHTTDGVFESVAVVAEGLEDVLYAIVRRTINCRSVRYVERLKTRLFAAQDDAFFVDCALTYDGTPTTTITGLHHLNGKTVQILADGAVHPPRVVASGSITLESAASVVQVGLPYTSDLQTLPLAFEGVQGGGQFMRKNLNGVAVRVTRSNLVKAGPSFSKLTEFPARDHTDPYGSPPALKTAELRFAVGPNWNSDGTLCVRQDQPLPLTVLNLTLDVALGG